MSATVQRFSVVVELGSGVATAPTDVSAEIRSGALVGDLIVAAGALVGQGDVTRLRLADGQVVDADVPMEDLDIRDGDVLVLVADQPSSGGLSRFEMVGDLIDARTLPVGRSAIGRDADNDIIIDHHSVSRRHASLTVGNRIVVTDDGSKNGTFVDDREVRGTAEVGAGSTVTFGGVSIVIRDDPECPAREVRPRPTDAIGPQMPGREWFNRPPTVVHRIEPVIVHAPELPAAAMVHRLPWLSAAIPVVMALAVYVLSTSTSAGGGLDGGYAVISVVFLLMGPLMIVTSHLESKRTTRAQVRDGRALFDAGLDHAASTARAAVAIEVDVRRSRHVSPEGVARRIQHREDRLWEWTAADSGPCLRVGVARLPTAVRLVDNYPSVADSRTADLVDRVRAVRRAVEVSEDLPVLIDLDQVGHVGITGPAEACRDLARWLVLQLAAERSPLSLDVTVISDVIGCDGVADWEWVKWLPHRSADRHLRSAMLLSEHHDVERLLTDLAVAADESTPPSWTLVVVDGGDPVDRALASAVMQRGPSRGVHLVWIEADASLLPAECGAVVEIREDLSAVLRVGTVGAIVDDVAIDRLSRSEAEVWARSMAPLVDRSGARPDTEEPPRSVSIADLFGGPRLFDDVASVVSRWSQRSTTLRAPIGFTADGVLAIDLHHDGPHGIIGGTTGAGKSELLQTLVVSLAATHSPTHLNVLLIDYKGGAAFGPCVGLPHTVGVVTDLDGDLVDRVLTSLGAELRRRELIFSEAGAKDLSELMDRSPGEAPPSLVIVVDEFASLVGEVPTFMPGMVDLARRGRSLGLHVLLATQRPAGVIGDDLRANASLRIALRFADVVDSVDVLGDPAAASIDRATPGRAIAQLGNGETVCFQTAYCGGRGTPSPTGFDDRSLSVPPVRLAPFTARRPRRTEEEPTRESGYADTDLDRLVRSIGAAAIEIGSGQPRRPWLQPLPPHVSWFDLVDSDSPVGRGPELDLVIGLGDEPELQRQAPEYLDLDRLGSVAVYGRAGAGKSSCLRTIAVAAVIDRDPAAVRVDGIEFASSSLQVLEQLPQVGSVLPGDDVERVGRLLDDLSRTVAARVGSSMFDPSGAGRRLVLIDNFTAFAAHYDQLDGGRTVDRVARLVAEGRSAGVHVILSADRRVGVPASVSGGIGCRIVLEMASEDEETSLGVPMGVAGRPRPPGRAQIGSRCVHVATLDNSSGGEPGRAFDALVADQRSRFDHVAARPVGRLGDRISRGQLGDHPGGRRVGLGVNGSDLTPRWLDLAEGCFLVAGPRRSGRSTALMTIATSLREGSASNRLVAVAARPSGWTESGLWGEVAIGAAAVELIDRLLDRSETTRSLVVVVDDLTDLDDATDEAVARLVAASRATSIRVVASVEAGLARTRFGGAVPELRRERRALLLQPDVDLDGDLVGVRLPRRGSSASSVGRGEFVDRGDISQVQVALPG